jgi:ABC-type multidrug transport system fused ATPase/permease subunit
VEVVRGDGGHGQPVLSGGKPGGAPAEAAAAAGGGTAGGGADATAGVRKSALRQLMAASRPEAAWAAAGVLFAAGYGANYPLFSLLFGRATAALQGAEGRGEVGDAVGALAAGICGVGVGAGLCVFGQHACFSVVGERLTARLRRRAFAQLLRRRVGYFDLPGHGAAALCARLATEAAEVRGAAAERLGLLAQNGVTAVLGAAIALAASWRMGLVVISCVPLMTAGALIENRLYRGGFEALGGDEAGELLGQALQQIRTVAAFTLEAPFLADFQDRLGRVAARGTRLGHVSGAAYGFSQGIQYAIYGLGFWYGGKLVLDGEWDRPAAQLAGECDPLVLGGMYADAASCAVAVNMSYGFGRFMEAFWAVLLACWGVGEALSFSPDAAKALTAASRIFDMIEGGGEELEPVDDGVETAPGEGLGGEAGKGTELLKGQLKGELELRDVWFRYPARPEAAVLRGLTLKVPAGRTVALVGESGCGKSTVVQLLLRFYDPEAGAVLLDGVDVRGMGVAWLRRQIGLVAQEPVRGPPGACFNSALKCKAHALGAGQLTRHRFVHRQRAWFTAASQLSRGDTRLLLAVCFAWFCLILAPLSAAGFVWRQRAGEYRLREAVGSGNGGRGGGCSQGSQRPRLHCWTYSGSALIVSSLQQTYPALTAAVKMQNVLSDYSV